MKAQGGRRRERGVGLILVFLVAAFMAALGLSLVTLTMMGPKMSGGVRQQEEAFNAAEAGFDAARVVIENHLAAGEWTSFTGHTLAQPAGFDIPFISGAANPAYFKRLTDEEILQAFDSGGDGTADVSPLLFFRQTFARDENGAVDPRLAYTAFLIDEEAGGGDPDPGDVHMIVIGEVRAGTRILATTRLAIVLAFQNPGTGG